MMVTRVQITTTVASDGSVRLLEHEIEPAGIRAGDRIRIEIVKDDEREKQPVPTETSPSTVEDQFELDALARLSFDEWLRLGRANLALEGLDIDEIRRRGEEFAADEFWERFTRRD